MALLFAVRAHGPLALFCSPWLRAEPHTEPVMTPSAAAGLLRQLYRKPEFEWVIRAIHVLSPIRYETIRRKGVTGDYTTTGYKQVSSRKVASLRQPDQTLQTQTCLSNVDYIIHAQVHLNPIERRSQGEVDRIVDSYLSKGSVFGIPCGGRVEFPLDVEYLGARREYDPPPFEFSPINVDQPLGATLLGMSPVDARADRWDPVFTHLELVQGTVWVPREPYVPLLAALAAASIDYRAWKDQERERQAPTSSSFGGVS